LSGEPDPGAAASAWMRSDLAAAFDLRSGPLFRYGSGSRYYRHRKLR
jgi:hypothetical protein